MIKKALFSLLVLSFLVAPLALKAQSADDIAKLIAQLEQQIAYLKQQLAQLQGQPGQQSWCFTFEKNLGVGSGGKDVDALHTALTKEGISISPMPVPASTGATYFEVEKKKSQVTFTEATAAAVSAFQLKYAKEILAPLGLANPTGYVGPSTRKVLNRLYGCGYVIPAPYPQPSPYPQPYPVPVPIPSPVPEKQPLTVVSPNGGESWQRGTTQRIGWNWRTADFVGPDTVGKPFTIYLTPTNWSLQNPQLIINPSICCTSYYDWNVGLTKGDAQAPTGSYNISICAYNNSGNWVCDETDSYFKIYDSDYSGNKPPTISGVEGPTALKIGETGTWTVQASDPENGTLSYSVIWGDETMVSGGVASAPTMEKIQQTATFTHSYAQAGTYYPKFRVTDNAGQSNSTSLSVVVGGGGGVNPPTLSPVQVLSPNGGESWQKGSSYPIQWKTNATDVFIRISISNFSGNWYPVYSKTENDGVEYWTIPSTIKSGTYWMSVSLCRSDNDCYWNDWSDSSFKIYDQTTINQPPKIVTPSGNPIVSVGETVNIALIASDPDGDRLSMSVDWGDNTGSASSCPAYPLSHTDQLFSNQELRASHVYSAAKTYSVTARIIDCRGGEVKQSLEVEVNLVPASVQVLSPNGGETWFKGQTYTVSWGATGAPEVSVYLVRDSDSSFKQAIRHNFVSGRANSITWIVPGGDTATTDIAAGSDYRIWVIGGGATAVEDKSDRPFAINMVTAH